MALEVKLQAFEGPLDLLLHLIEKNRVDIRDIPIAPICAQYIDYISSLTDNGEQMDTMSSFLVMASELLDIKARMLLPQEVDQEALTDPREDLALRLIEYKTYKFISAKLCKMEESAAVVFYHKQSIPEEAQAFCLKADVYKTLDEAGVTLQSLYQIFREVMKRRKDLSEPNRSQFGHIRREKIDAAETMQFVERYIMNRRHCTFRSLLMLRSGRMYTVVAFLTILELMKQGHIFVRQDKNFGVINIEANGPSPG